MKGFILQGAESNPKPICDGCKVSQGHLHKCHGIVKIDDYLIRVVHIHTPNTTTPNGDENGFLYEGMASGLTSRLLELVCRCTNCNSHLFPSRKK